MNHVKEEIKTVEELKRSLKSILSVIMDLENWVKEVESKLAPIPPKEESKRYILWRNTGMYLEAYNANKNFPLRDDAVSWYFSKEIADAFELTNLKDAERVRDALGREFVSCRILELESSTITNVYF